jgi:hypothetical protein
VRERSDLAVTRRNDEIDMFSPDDTLDAAKELRMCDGGNQIVPSRERLLKDESIVVTAEDHQ